MHRIRRAMGDIDSLYGLSDMQEVDEGFIVTATQSKVDYDSKNSNRKQVILDSSVSKW
jgi:hypothetical protein